MMGSVVLFIFTITCYLLVNKQWASASFLQKPVLELVTGDQRNIIMKGDNVTLKCVTESGKVNQFYLVHMKEDGENEPPVNSSGVFPFMNIQTEKDGDYVCKQCHDRVCSDLSSPMNIFVRETYPRPDIHVSPRRATQPGATITITCRTHYSNVEFSVLKNGVIVTKGSSGENYFSYVINNAKNDSMGYYSCMYESRTNGMQSWRSNPMEISVIELLAPSMTCEEDPNDSTMLRINCTAPENHKYKEFSFTLIDGSEVIQDAIRAIENRMTFSISKPKYTVKKYVCTYHIKVNYDYADSLQSIIKYESKGFYILMFIRHILSALILILMGIILLLHFKYLRNSGEGRPDLPPARVRYGKKTKVEWTSDN